MSSATGYRSRVDDSSAIPINRYRRAQNHHVAAEDCQLVVFHAGLTTVRLNGIVKRSDPAIVMGESLLERTADGDQLSFE